MEKWFQPPSVSAVCDMTSDVLYARGPRHRVRAGARLLHTARHSAPSATVLSRHISTCTSPTHLACIVLGFCISGGPWAQHTSSVPAYSPHEPRPACRPSTLSKLLQHQHLS